MDEAITALVLAGGRGRRMGGIDKGWASYRQRSLIEWVLSRLARQVDHVLINANRSRTAYEALGWPVIGDRSGGYQGPLMGIWSGLCAAETPLVLVVPCDTPCLPLDLVERLYASLGAHDIAVAHDGERSQPVVALLRRGLAADLERALAAGERKVERWYARHAWVSVDFSDCPEAFANINSPHDVVSLTAS
ncbi:MULTISPECIES: molybdenum cofactor guanylyltransferase MobA [Halomonadaceae]|uniref:Molybdenum cofactor guanylyltransferase n=1 Tax=Modicisalibacter zincidurans TaxID=1178777 RepID=A0ABP9QXS4_9GAMM|nr:MULTISPECIES: molybdenum cofactor guanylyltransferase MobA [Halomonas]MCD6008937.1 molybdenum cofactor guanylyltransferase [Halomonas sp. IOP_31]